VGKQNEMNRLLSVPTILLLPSERESFGLVPSRPWLEGPLHCTQVGGIPEVVSHGVDGFLYGVGDVSSMAEGVPRDFSMIRN